MQSSSCAIAYQFLADHGLNAFSHDVVGIGREGLARVISRSMACGQFLAWMVDMTRLPFSEALQAW